MQDYSNLWNTTCFVLAEPSWCDGSCNRKSWRLRKNGDYNLFTKLQQKDKNTLII